MDYIQRPHKKDETCVFCVSLASSDGPENLIVFRGQRAYIILNRYPYTSGHVMVVPNAHQPDLNHLDRDTRSEVMELANLSTQVLHHVYKPQGFNLGINLGAAAGAGILGHIHLHIVPRWQGDTNFMSTLGMTRVLPESLEDTFWRLKREFDHQAPKA
jgi:ATP adenylyltransferase